MLTFAIPTWNRADKLGLGVASICEQVKRKDGFRVVVVDHKSTDNTAQVLEQFSKKYEFLSQGFLC